MSIMSVKSPERQRTALFYDTVDFSSLEGLPSLRQFTASFLQKWQKYSTEGPACVYLPPGVSVQDMNYYFCLSELAGLRRRRAISGKNRSQVGCQLWEESGFSPPSRNPRFENLGSSEVSKIASADFRRNKTDEESEGYNPRSFNLQLAEWQKPLGGVFLARLGAAQDLSSTDVRDLVLHARPKSPEAIRFAFVASEYWKMVRDLTFPALARFLWPVSNYRERTLGEITLVEHRIFNELKK